MFVDQFVDVFPGVTLDPLRWQFGSGATVLDGVVDLQGVITDTVANNLIGTGSFWSIELVELPANVSPLTLALLSLDPGGPFVQWNAFATGFVVHLQATSRAPFAGSTNPVDVVYNRRAHRFLQIVDDGADWLWQASPDGVIWSTLGSVPHFPITSGFLELGGDVGTKVANLNNARCSCSAAAERGLDKILASVRRTYPG